MKEIDLKAEAKKRHEETLQNIGGDRKWYIDGKEIWWNDFHQTITIYDRIHRNEFPELIEILQEIEKEK